MVFSRVHRYAQDILEGLAYLHSNNIVHRDIKPSNILIIQATDRAVISDLGIGKPLGPLEEDSELTPDSVIIGTPAYMAIELMENQPASTASDMYSTGVVLFKMLTGQVPFSASDLIALINKAQTEPVPKISSFRPAEPKPLAELVEMMLSKEPAARPSAQQAFDGPRRMESIDWEEADADDSQSAPAQLIAAIESESMLFETRVAESEEAKPRGFFSSEISRFNEFMKSSEFYRIHLDQDYKSLLFQANVAFWLWLACSGASFAILAVGVLLLYQEQILAGSVTIASEALVLFIQRVFKDREEYYRRQASIKNKHLELGNLWNLALQSVDGLGDPPLRVSKLSGVVDALTSRIKGMDQQSES